MEQFENVTAVKKANVYFDGKVTSRSVFFEDGSKKTLGIMMPGQYKFGTVDKEEMEILAGVIHVLLQGSDIWSSYKAGECFEVPANSEFSVSTETIVDYCCSYTKE